uniref:Uncharacterized protein n=1 Tax=viral metagenome TaxID=1070528 RepID=A0A6C0C092_9ZZZZ
MFVTQSLDTDTVIVLALLLVCSLSIFAVIDYTYGAHARTAYPKKSERMHLRGFLYTLLVCIAILFVVVTYLILTRHTRDMCGRLVQTLVQQKNMSNAADF